MQMPRPGDFFEGKYEIIETLGEGGFAHVYRARDHEVGREVAVKVLRPREYGGYDGNVESRFAREARVIASLQDPHTITMYEFGKTADGLMFMVFEYVRGRDLAEAIKERGPLPPPIVEHILRQLLSALGEAHASGILHRDIKPANVIVFEYMDDPWRVKLLDFGIAKPMPTDGGRDFTQLTRDGAVIGTPRYMAPEQFFGEQLTPSADIYGLGLLAFELLFGRPAIEGQTSQETMRLAVSAEPLVVPPLPGAEGLVRVITRMLERNPANRFANADAVVYALQNSGRIVAPPPRIDSSSGSGQFGPFHSGSSEEFATTPRSSSDAALYAPQYTTRTKRSRSRAVLLFLLGLASLGIVGALGIILDARKASAPAVPSPSPRRDVPFVTPDEPAAPTNVVRDAGLAERQDLGPADGCGKEVDGTGFMRRTAKLGFQSGSYTVYIPQDYDPHRRHSVVLLFHNALGKGENVIKDTQYDDLAREQSLVLIAPDSNGDTARPWYSPDDLELTRLALEQTRDELCLDDDHVYALGHGGGGNFVMELRCAIPLSAIAFSATGEHTTQKICDSDHPVPTMRLYGNRDRHVPADGGRGCWDQNTFRSATEIAELWRERNDTERKPKVWAKEPGGVCNLYEGKAPYVDCELNGGHDWPTAPAKLEIPGCGEPPPDFPMGDTIYRFFAEHGVPRHAQAESK